MSAIKEKVRSLVSRASNPQDNIAQITIDFFEDFDYDFFAGRDEVECPIWRDEV